MTKTIVTKKNLTNIPVPRDYIVTQFLVTQVLCYTTISLLPIPDHGVLINKHMNLLGYSEMIIIQEKGEKLNSGILYSAFCQVFSIDSHNSQNYPVALKTKVEA